jgi:hypothetical protein
MDEACFLYPSERACRRDQSMFAINDRTNGWAGRIHRNGKGMVKKRVPGFSSNRAPCAAMQYNPVRR